MKIVRYTLLICSLFAIFSLSAENKLTNKLSGFLHNPKFEHKFIVGYNLGFTGPIPLPKEVRSIDAYWPEFTPQLGYRFTYNYAKHWGVSTGLQLDLKGMGATDKVKYMHTNAVMDNATINGYFRGKNEIRVRTAQVTLPLLLVYKPSQNWQVRFGGYVSYRNSAQFSGTVWDGYLLPTMDSNPIPIKEKNKAVFDFGNQMKSYDAGLMLGGERSIGRHFGVYADLDWGLTPVFPSNFKAMDFKMYNVYLSVGMSYRI